MVKPSMSPPENAVVPLIDEQRRTRIQALDRPPAAADAPPVRPSGGPRLRPQRDGVAPTSGSWLNQGERFFGMITETPIRRGMLRSVAVLEEAIMEFPAAHPESPRPFVWAAGANLILDARGGEAMP